MARVRRAISVLMSLLLAILPLLCVLFSASPTFAKSGVATHKCCPESSKKSDNPCEGCPFSYSALKHGVTAIASAVIVPSVDFAFDFISTLKDLSGFGLNPIFSSLEAPLRFHSPPGGAFRLFLSLSIAQNAPPIPA